MTGYQSKKAAAQAIDKVNWADHEPDGLAKPEQEPHSWYSKQVDDWMTNKTRKEHERLNSYTHKFGKFDLALYTTPPQRTWVGLTAEDVFSCYSGQPQDDADMHTFANAIEAKLKEKNT